jgi:hypothetical protein
VVFSCGKDFPEKAETQPGFVPQKTSPRRDYLSTFFFTPTIIISSSRPALWQPALWQRTGHEHKRGFS